MTQTSIQTSLSAQETDTPADISDEASRADNSDRDDDLAIPAFEPTIITGGGGDTGGSTVFALTGASGGVGTTTLAIQLAHDLALQTQAQNTALLRHTEPKVCIIDLDFETGACAPYLDLPPSLHMSDLQGDASRVDRALTHALMSTHESGIALLAAPNGLGGNDHVNPDTVLALLDSACDIYDHIILDVPRFWRPWTHAALAAADHVAMVTELTIPALHLCRQRLSYIEERIDFETPIDVIINKYERRSFRNALRIGDAKTGLNRDPLATICEDSESVKEAVNCGEPVRSIRSESRYVKDVKKLLDLWQKGSVLESQKPTRRWGRERRKARA